MGAAPPYRTLVATPGGADVRSDSGVRVGADVSLGEVARSRRQIDMLTVVGGLGTLEVLDDEGFLADVARLSRRVDRITSVCTGSLVLAAAGLLDGYAATTHWALADHLARWGVHEGSGPALGDADRRAADQQDEEASLRA